MRNTNYIIRFVLIMTVLVAFILAGMETVLKPIHELNAAVYNKKSVLLSIADQFDKPIESMTTQEVQDIFNNDIEELVVDPEGNIVEGERAEDINMADQLKRPKAEQHYPLYVYNQEDGSKIYIVSVRGQGLWDAIWGNIALKQDLKTIVGASFDHAGETPGLGAEIKDDPGFPTQFIGKGIYDDKGEYTSVQVIKGIIRQPQHQVEGISGATITSRGVSDMLYSGIKNYEPYFEKIQK